MIPPKLEVALQLTAFNNINAVILIDEKLDIVWKNKQFQKLFSEDFSIIDQIKIINNVDFEYKIKQGEKFSVQFNLPGIFFGYTVFFSPIQQNEKFYLLEFVAKSDTDLIVQNTDIKDILQTLSIHFRAPISRISNVMENMEREINKEQISNEILKNCVLAIDKGCRQLLKSFTNFIDVARYSSGLYELETSFIFVPTFLHNFIESCKEQLALQNKNIPIHLHLEKENCYANFDENKITLALVNIIANSCIYTKKNNHIEIYLKQNKQEKNFTITIQDFGIGMDKITCKNATIPYFIGCKNFNYAPSQGLGLALTKYIITLHHGEIKISSKEKLGTTVEITLPLNIDENSKNVLNSPARAVTNQKFSQIAIQFAFNQF